ncbi:MAG: NAD(P)/FAD-dependent oxidoreductase [Gemmatimonadota bacterium]|nr:NAD(P)/FAD-dependent oxidoreductase [Gemmatimonadota bacterium]
MSDRHLIIIGGGLAGLSAGCYARRAGFRTTIVEHNLALGGVCAAWHRGPYLVDGCIHWLTGGAFQQVYEELDILPAVKLNVLDTWVTYRDASTGFEVALTRDLDALARRLTDAAPEDAAEIARMRDGARALLAMHPSIDSPELATVGDTMSQLWEMRGALGSLVHFRKPMGRWAAEHVRSAQLRRMFAQLMPESTPALFLLLVLGYLGEGYLSRPVGGTEAFRDALVHAYRSLGGESMVHSTVDEVVVRGDRARGVRLADGTIMDADLVLSTSSGPETVLRLLGGRYEGDAMRKRMAAWKTFDPIVLASFGVAAPFAETPSLLELDRVPPFEVGGRRNDSLMVRVCNDDPCFAPAGHTVIQALVPTDYEWWATRGARYNDEKDVLAERLVGVLAPHFPGLADLVRLTDVATPLTYWHTARSWRGAFEGWQPSGEAIFARLHKRLSGLDGFYMAGQWVEPGGGVPTAVMSGRHAVQLMCRDEGRVFTPTGMNWNEGRVPRQRARARA